MRAVAVIARDVNCDHSRFVATLRMSEKAAGRARDAPPLSVPLLGSGLKATKYSVRTEQLGRWRNG